ncbi:hypothetical protein KIW84_043865 [Lathyrus oleraceus]|uniref:non-specific serine/threonine protein kinase n=1 Tax=Pisum sativum TaxID=3888 RepID=A0A9D5APN1_PEA|nr:hypothetical protein KIW84_043865 [Pisum sativum]
MSNLISLSMFGNNINGPVPGTFKGLQKLQKLELSNNDLHGSFIDELCEMESLIKVIDLQSEEKSRTFDAECNAMRNLRHRNLVKIISSCSNLNFKSLVMEFMSNGSVDKWLYSDNYYLTFLQRLNIMIDVASALEYLHHGSPIPVVHCDLKPTNVLLDEDMVAHVSDFGIAKLMDEGQSKTHTDTLATIGYLAPGHFLISFYFYSNC